MRLIDRDFERVDDDGQFDLARRYRAGDREAGDRLILCNLPYVYKIARKYLWNRSLDSEDLVHAGIVGLLVARDRYDPDRGVPFMSYAWHFVQREMTKYARGIDREVSDFALDEERDGGVGLKIVPEIDRGLRSQDARRLCGEFAATLNLDERIVWTLRVVAEHPAKVREIGALLGVSRQRVSVIEVGDGRNREGLVDRFRDWVKERRGDHDHRIYGIQGIREEHGG